MRAAIYARVSKDDQRDARSVGEQEQECRRVCAEENWNIVSVFSDNDRSASRYAKKTRPAYDEMVEALRSGIADVLVLWEPSRGSRDLLVWSGLLDMCRRLSISIHIVTHGRTYDLSKARDWRTLAEDGVDSAYESEKTRERIMRAVGRNATAGRPHGKLLFGYRRVYDARGNFVAQEPDEATARLIQTTATRVAAGESCRSIAIDYNNRKIAAPRGGSWDGTQIKRLVTNPAYIGKRVHQGRIVGDAVWPAILDDELYWTCHALLTDPLRRTVIDKTVKHLLTGIATCGVCGSSLAVLPNRGVRSYICRTDFHVAIGADALDAYVVAKVKERLFRLDVAELDDDTAADHRAQARRELAELEARLDSFTKQATLGKLSASRLGAIERELEPLIADARRRSRAPAGKRIVAQAVANPYLWQDLTMMQKREVVASMVTIQVATIGRGRRGYDLADRVTVEPRRALDPTHSRSDVALSGS